MKTYHFRSLLLAFGFFLAWASIFTYSCIWLNRGFEVQAMIRESEQRYERYVDYKYGKLNDRMDTVMPACFKGVPTR